MILCVIAFALIIDFPKLPAFNILGRQVELSFPLKLGLDLQGGIQLILEAQTENIAQEDRDAALESVKEVIEKRVNLFGVSESLVQTSKVNQSRRILVELPGLKDASAAAQMVGKTAQLVFKEIPATRSAEATQSAIIGAFIAEPTNLTGADLKRAQVTFAAGSSGKSGPQVALEFSSEGANKFAQITRRNIGKPVYIFLDEQLVSYPMVEQEILGNAVITGQFTAEEAKNLAIQLNAGALPVPVKILEQRQIGPTLGKESIDKSLVAGIIGLLIIMVYMVAFYGMLGVIADLGLLIYALITLAIFKTGLFLISPITLSLAGIAAFILSIGMAVDANILIFERMKEELRWGKDKKMALELGFKRAWTSIWASNVSSLITAAILYYMGTPVVKGFALTLAIGVLVSMFSAIVVTRTILRLIIK